MRRGLVISIALHLLILLSALAVLPFGTQRPPQKPTPLPVDLVTPAQFTKIKAGQRKAKAEQDEARGKFEAAKKIALKKRKSSKLKSVKAPAPKPAPKKAEAAPKKLKTAVKKAKPKKVVKKVTPKPKKAAKPKTVAKNNKFDADKIAALLNKTPDAGTRPPAGQEKKKSPKPAKGRAVGRDRTMTFNEIDALRAKISQCWNPPVGGLGADAIKVKLRMQLRQDGSLSREPQVVNRAGSPYFQAAADAAVRAVMLCQPYQLPARKYAAWRDMILNFDPREMFGG